MMRTMNKLAKTIHENAVKHGFYDEKREIGTLLMLCVSELSEALEADRQGKYANLREFEEWQGRFIPPSEKEINDKFKVDFEYFIKDSFQDEIADTIIRLLDLCGYLNIDIDEHIRLKMKYNEMRENKHGKRY